MVLRRPRTSGLAPAELGAIPSRPAPIPTRPFHVTSRPATGTSPSALGARPRTRAIRLTPAPILVAPSSQGGVAAVTAFRRPPKGERPTMTRRKALPGLEVVGPPLLRPAARKAAEILQEVVTTEEQARAETPWPAFHPLILPSIGAS